MKETSQDRHTGSSFDSFLSEQGILEDVESVALKRVLAWQLQQAMSEKRISKMEMAKKLKTSRSQVDRLLSPSHTGTSIATITRAAHVLGKRVRLEIVEGGKSKPKPRRRAIAPRSAGEPRKKRA